MWYVQRMSSKEEQGKMDMQHMHNNSRAAWPLVARTLLALVIPCEQVGNAYVVELVQRQQQSGFGIDPQFEVNSSMMVAACGSSVSSSMQLCVSSGA